MFVMRNFSSESIIMFINGRSSDFLPPENLPIKLRKTVDIISDVALKLIKAEITAAGTVHVSNVIPF